MNQDQEKMLSEFSTAMNDGFFQSIRKCFPVFAENGLSPIEEKFLFALLAKVVVPGVYCEPTSFGKAGLLKLTDCKILTSQRMYFSGKSKELYDKGYYNPFCYFVRSQFPVELEDRKMRLDFVFFIFDSVDLKKMRGIPQKPYLSIVIELDGHDFHEKTKEQAQKDKERDRILQHGGYQVLRYTGSEVWNDPSGTIDDVMHRIFGFIRSHISVPGMTYISSRKPWKPPEW